jgi:hypothetical protein
MKTVATIVVFFCSLVVVLPAQNLKVIPQSYTNLEGNSTNTYPYGRQTTEQQILINGSLISKGTALIRGLNIRPNQTSSGYPAYKKNYTMTVYGTSVTAAQMTTNPATNIGSARGTQVFNGTLSLPAVKPLKVWPAGFLIKWPFKSVYTLPANKVNFLAHIKTADTTTPPTSPGRWGQDSILFRDSSTGNEKAKVGDRCTLGNGSYLSISAASTVNVGSQVSITLKLAGGAQAGTWPTVVLSLGPTVTKAGFPFDLGLAGMPGCYLLVDPLVALFLSESGGTYPAFTQNIPNDNKLFGAVFFAQGLGATKNGLVGGVVTDTWQFRVGPATAQTRTQQSNFRVVTTSTDRWSMSTVGAYCPVVQLDGVFP